ncbi:MAG: 4Fe-4S binding protein, partial [Smithellaceae bacterium]
CGRHLHPYLDDKNRDRGAIQLPACLGIVTRGCWYEAGLKTEIELRLDQCEQCSLAKTLPRLKYNIETAAEWLIASGHTPLFNLTYQSGQSKVKKNLKAVEAGLKVTSRRDLFLSLVRAGRREPADAMQGDDASFSRYGALNGPGHCLPNWQKRLAELYSKNMIEGFPPAYWPTIAIDSQCVHCGLCVLFCPSGALQRIIKDGICAYHFTSGLCIDCRICQLICEQKAISREREKVGKPFESICIYSSPVDECRRCGSMTSDFRTRLCYRCAQEASIDQEFKDVCRTLLIRDKE